MNFIERLFGASPDGGSGALEFLLIAMPVLGVCVLARLRRARQGHTLSRSPRSRA